jgi:hypothetical protein
MFFEEKDKDDREITALIDQGIRSSVASSLGRRHASDRKNYLKKTEQFSWDAYQIRLALHQGDGDKTKSVGSRAIDIQVDPHSSARTIRRAISSPSPNIASVSEEDHPEQDAQGSSEGGEELSDNPSDQSGDDLPLSQRSGRMSATGKRKK